MTVRTATGLIAWYLRTIGFRGWSSFWRTIYVLPGHEHNERLLRHERKQIERDEQRGQRDGPIVHEIVI